MRIIQDLAGYMLLRTFFIFASTAFSIIVIMLLLNIITVEELAIILDLSPEATAILKNVFFRIQEVTGNILNIISQLLNKLFGWAGVDADLGRIDINIDGSDFKMPDQIPSPQNIPSTPLEPTSFEPTSFEFDAPTPSNSNDLNDLSNGSGMVNQNPKK